MQNIENIVITDLHIGFLPPDLTLVQSEMVVLGVLGYSRTQHSARYDEGVLSQSRKCHLRELNYTLGICQCLMHINTHYCRCVDFQQYIWNWKIFPDQVFISCISRRVIIVSSKHFYIIERHWIRQWGSMNQFPINCNSVISLKIMIKHIKTYKVLSPFYYLISVQ